MAQGSDAAAYLIDAWQRIILTWDVLRERGNQSLAHIQSGKPPVLVFDYETVLDGRTLPRPANYALLRVKPGAGHPPTDPRKRPFVVIDPRAGHGPGIGGFKIDSQVGIALKKGHPCYFVTFFPQPLPGQTIESVAAAEIAFLAKVNELHPEARGALRDRQLPGGLGIDDAGRAGADARGSDPAGRLAALLLGGRRRREPDALLGRPARRQLDRLAAQRPRRRQVRRRLPGEQLRGLDPANTHWAQALQPLREGRHRARALPSVRTVVGRSLLHEPRGDRLDCPEPLHRQQAVGRRRRVVRPPAPGRHPQRPRADHRVRLVGRQHHAPAAGARLDPRPLPHRRGHPPRQPDDRLLPAREGRPPRPVRLRRRRPQGNLGARQRAGPHRHPAAGTLRGGHPGHPPRHAGVRIHRGALPDPVRAADDRGHPGPRRRPQRREGLRGGRARVADQPGGLRHRSSRPSSRRSPTRRPRRPCG